MGMLYRHIQTQEIVYEEDAEEYVKDQLGLTITPKGTGGSYTKDQLEFLGEFTEWYFSGDWVKYDEKELKRDE